MAHPMGIIKFDNDRNPEHVPTLKTFLREQVLCAVHACEDCEHAWLDTPLSNLCLDAPCLNEILKLAWNLCDLPPREWSWNEHEQFTTARDILTTVLELHAQSRPTTLRIQTCLRRSLESVRFSPTIDHTAHLHHDLGLDWVGEFHLAMLLDQEFGTELSDDLELNTIEHVTRQIEWHLHSPECFMLCRQLTTLHGYRAEGLAPDTRIRDLCTDDTERGYIQTLLEATFSFRLSDAVWSSPATTIKHLAAALAAARAA